MRDRLPDTAADVLFFSSPTHSAQQRTCTCLRFLLPSFLFTFTLFPHSFPLQHNPLPYTTWQTEEETMVFYVCGFRKPLDGTSKTGAHVSLCFQPLFLVYYCLCTRKNRNRLQQTDREVPRVFPCVFLPPLTHTVSSLSQLFLPPLIEARSNTILASRGYGALGFNSHGICVWGGKKYSLCCIVFVFFISFILIWFPSFTAGSK